MKHKKRVLFQSVMSLILCCAMLVGTTFAWFTDSVSSKGNIIQSGKLDIEMDYANDLLDAGSDQWLDASQGAIFNYEHWEPGYTDLKYLKITNDGNLAFQYQLTFGLSENTTADGGEVGETTGSEETMDGGELLAEEGGMIADGGGVTTPTADAMKLAEVIDVYYANVTEGITTREDAIKELTKVGTLADLINGRIFAAEGILLPEKADASQSAEENVNAGYTTAAIMLKMQESAGNAYMNASAGDGFCVKVLATQYAYEKDAFGTDYDSKAVEEVFLPIFNGPVSGSADVTTENGMTTEKVTIKVEDVDATVPAGVAVAEGVEQLTLTVSPMNSSNANLELGSDYATTSLDVHMEGVSSDNTTAILVNLGKVLPVGMNQGNVKLYHVENGKTNAMTQVFSLEALDAHNEFYYDPATGNTTVAMATFSEVAVVADMENAWNGTVATAFAGGEGTKEAPYIIANADQLAYLGDLISNDNDNYGSKHYKLIADINLGGEENTNKGIIFYPIGYHKVGGIISTVDVDDMPEAIYEINEDSKSPGSTVADGDTTNWYTYGGSFKGTFDGAGHKISNIYQNTWQLKGNYDGNYWNAAMGLFGYVYGGTVKNLTVDNFSSDGEFTPTGVIAAYAAGDAKFENIAITKCNPRVYNTGNGGIIGIAGNTSAANDDHITLKNITVDNSNKISALWGSWDVACGGLVGMYRGNVNGETPTGDTISFENCHVSAQIDVYNDVCANYQYYAYRYAGMIIGSVRHNTTNADGKTIPNMTNISAENCTVNYGDWNDYYYCEFEKNTMASYSEDYQFSRVPHSELNFTDSNGNGVVDADERASVTGCKHDHTAEENHQAIYLPFHQLFTGYSWGVSSIGLKEYSGIVTDLGITEGDQQESVVKFETVNNVTTTFKSGTPVLISDLFKAVDDLPIKIDVDNVQVFVSPVGNDSTASGTYTANTDDWTNGTLTFSGDGAAEISITDYNFCKPTMLKVTVIGTEIFEHAFPNTDSYLYRVGNQNAVSLGSLFTLTDGAEISGDVQVTIERVEQTSQPMTFAVVATAEEGKDFTYTPNATTWNSGTITFDKSFTGPVKVNIKDGASGTTSLYLEVIKAKNITKAESATANDVVLLNDTSGTFVVSGGHTFYGNGFTVKLPTTSVQEQGQGFTGYISIGASQDSGTASGGNLDNVRIEGPVYPEMYIYRDQAKITDKNDPDYGSGSNMRYFRNSVIVYGGNCTISNSYISGSRTALCLRGGNNVVIENTTLSGGAYANMQICAGSKVTLRDLTTVQVNVTDSYGKGKTAHGLGIAVDSAVVDLYIEGELNQYNWLNQTQWNSIVPSSYQSQFPKFFTSNDFNKYWHYLNGGTDPYVNMAFIYACNWDTSKIHDNRKTVNYGTQNATIASVSGGVYSKVNTVGGNAIDDSSLAEPDYTSPGFNPVAPVFNFDNTANNDADDANDAADTYCVYDESSGTLKIGVSGDSKTIDLSGVSVIKDGTTLIHTAYLNGTQISGNSVTIKVADGAKQVLTFKATSNGGYDKEGNIIAGDVEYTWTVTIEIAVLAYPAPVWNMGGNYQFDKTNLYYAYYSTSQGYGEAVPIYEGIKVNYYNKSGTLVNLNLSGTTTHPTGSDNSNSNPFIYTLSDGSTLTMKFSSGWKSGATTHQFTTYNNKVYIYPQSLDNDNYVRAKTTNQDFDVKITYKFTDPNGQSTGEQTMRWYNAKASNGSVSTVQWKTFDSTNGKKASVCVTPDTLVTLADGTKKEIQYVSVGDEVLAWNFYTGEYEVVPASLAQIDGTGNLNVLHLYFEDGTELKVLGEHGIFDADLNTFIFIDEGDVNQYVGHYFIKQSGSGYKTVKLVDYKITTENTSAYTILSAYHYNVMLEDMWTVTPAHVGDNFFNPFDIGEGMKYDDAAVKADIRKYGLYTYEDFNHVLTEEQFDILNMAQFKVSVGKGYVTYDGLIYLIENFINR